MRAITAAATLTEAGMLRPDDPSLVQARGDEFAPELSHPPTDWFFEPPAWFDPTGAVDRKLWIDSDGRAAGWYYDASSCIIDAREGECWSPSPSPTANEIFHQGDLITAEGDLIQVGVIGSGGEHAPQWMAAEQAGVYYADVSKQKLVGRIYDVPYKGGYFLGAILPHVLVDDVDMLRRSGLSGDWRYRMRDNSGNRLEMFDAVGPWVVTRPGLPIARDGRTVIRLAAVGHPVYVGADPVVAATDFIQGEGGRFEGSKGKDKVDASPDSKHLQLFSHFNEISLDENQTSAVEAYTSGADTDFGSLNYTNMNECLRTNDCDEFEAFTNENLRSAMEPLRQDVVVYRGASSDVMSQLIVEDEFVEKGFSSTTLDRDIAESFAVEPFNEDQDHDNPPVMEITVPKGTEALYVPGITGEKGESELILKDGVKFVVTDIRGDGTILVEAV